MIFVSIIISMSTYDNVLIVSKTSNIFVDNGFDWRNEKKEL